MKVSKIITQKGSAQTFHAIILHGENVRKPIIPPFFVMSQDWYWAKSKGEAIKLSFRYRKDAAKALRYVKDYVRIGNG